MGVIAVVAVFGILVWTCWPNGIMVLQCSVVGVFWAFFSRVIYVQEKCWSPLHDVETGRCDSLALIPAFHVKCNEKGLIIKNGKRLQSMKQCWYIWSVSIWCNSLLILFIPNTAFLNCVRVRLDDLLTGSLKNKMLNGDMTWSLHTLKTFKKLLFPWFFM